MLAGSLGLTVSLLRPPSLHPLYPCSERSRQRTECLRQRAWSLIVPRGQGHGVPAAGTHCRAQACRHPRCLTHLQTQSVGQGRGPEACSQEVTGELTRRPSTGTLSQSGAGVGRPGLAGVRPVRTGPGAGASRAGAGRLRTCSPVPVPPPLQEGTRKTEPFVPTGSQACGCWTPLEPGRTCP